MLHAGHRQRVRERIRLYGTDAMHYHERLEALLFYAIPYRDTNPTAHLLAERFSSADKLFSAKREDFAGLSGVGEHTTNFLLLLGEIYRYYVNYKRQNQQSRAFGSMEDVIEFGKARLRSATDEATYLLMLDNRMEFLAFERIYDGHPADAAFTVGHVIRPALQHHASFGVLFHNHLSGIAVPCGGDVSATWSIIPILQRLDMPIIEHVLIAGNRHATVLQGALRDRDPNAASLHTDPIFPERIYSKTERGEAELSYASRLAFFIGGVKIEATLRDLLATYSLPSLIEGDRTHNLSLLGENVTVLFSLLHALFAAGMGSLQKIGNHAFGIADAARIVANRTRGCKDEIAYAFLLDEKDRLISYEKCGEGVPGAVLLHPRRILELAIFRSAPKLILAHTHPNGFAVPSEADVRLTREIDRLFLETGVRLLSHIVVADDTYAEVSVGNPSRSVGGRMTAILGEKREKE